MPVTVLPTGTSEARIPLLQILEVLDQLGERKKFKNDQPRLGQVREQIANDPERRDYYISQAIPRMESKQGQAWLKSWESKPPEVKAPGKPQTQAGRKYLWERDPTTGQWNQTRVPVGSVTKKWDKPHKVGPTEGWPEGTVIQTADTGEAKVLHAPKQPKTGALGKAQSSQLTNYTKAINQTLKKYGLKTGSILNPDGTINIESLSRNKKAIYEVLREKAARGDAQATEDLSRVDFWYSKIDQLTGIGTPEFKQMRKRTQKGLITHEFIPGKGLVPTGGR